MKTFIEKIKKVSLLAQLAVLGILVSSCATTKNNSYTTTDGIYYSGDLIDTENSEDIRETKDNNEKNKSSYYKEYFGSKKLLYRDVLENDEKSAIFTDIDAYYTTETLDDEGNVVIEERTYDEGDYGAWGTNAPGVEVNIYNNGAWGWNNWGWGWNNWGWGWNNWGWGWNNWGWGWNNWGWGHPHWGWGWNNWGWGHPHWGIGLGWGGFYSPAWGGNFNHSFAYNRGRRNSGLYGFRSAYRSGTRGNTSVRSNNRRGTYSRNDRMRRSNSRGTFTRGNSSSINRGRPTNSSRVNRGRPSNQRNSSINRNHRSSRSGSYNRSRSGSSRSGSFRGGSFRGGGGSFRGGGRGRH